MSEVGFLLRKQGKLKDAEAYYRRSLEGRERTLGRDRPDTLVSVNNLGTLLQALGKLDLAEPFLRRALEGSELSLGRDHSYTLKSVGNL